MSHSSSQRRRHFSAPLLTQVAKKTVPRVATSKTIELCPEIHIRNNHVDQIFNENRTLPTKSPKRTLYTFKEPLNTECQENQTGQPKRAKRYLIPPSCYKEKTDSLDDVCQQDIQAEHNEKNDCLNPFLFIQDEETRSHNTEKVTAMSPITSNRLTAKRKREVLIYLQIPFVLLHVCYHRCIFASQGVGS